MRSANKKALWAHARCSRNARGAYGQIPLEEPGRMNVAAGAGKAAHILQLGACQNWPRSRNAHGAHEQIPWEEPSRMNAAAGAGEASITLPKRLRQN